MKAQADCFNPVIAMQFMCGIEVERAAREDFVKRMAFAEQARAVEQGSEAWFAARAGHITMSCVHVCLTGTKDAKEKMVTRLVAERLTLTPQPEANSRSTNWGKEYEAQALADYSIVTGYDVQKVGFILHPTMPWVGGSPDGLVDDDGMNEVKCPYNSLIHARTWLNGVPEEHMPQIQGNLWVTGRKWCDFISYDPRMPAHRGRIFIKRVLRDDAYIARLERAVLMMLAQVNLELQEINAALDAAADLQLPVPQGV